MPSGSKAGDNQFDKKSKHSIMTDRNRRGNASGLGTNAIVPDPNPPRYTQSRFQELFSSDDEPRAKPVGVSRPAGNLERNASAVNTPPLSVPKSNAPSAASAYTGYEKPMQQVSQESSGNDNPKSGDSAGASLQDQKDGAVFVVHDDDGAKITGVEKEEQYEGDDELSSGELSSVEEKSG